MKRLLCISFFIMTACQDLKIDSNSSTKSLPSQGAQDDADSDVAVEPTPVGGAYLICAHDIVLNPAGASFGCRLENESGQKLSGFVPRDTDIIALVSNQSLAAKAIADASSFWHWSFDYTATDRAAYQVKFLVALPGLANSVTTVLDAHPNQNPVTPPTNALSSHLVFISSIPYRSGGTGSTAFNSLESADAQCSLLARNAQLPGTFVAILSDADRSARDRIKLQGPIRLTDGDSIANANVFWSRSHAKPIIRDENGNSIGGGTAKVWSGTLESGLSAAAEHCNNWTDASVNSKGRYGLGDKSDVWISDGQEGCDQSLRLYCINQ